MSSVVTPAEIIKIKRDGGELTPNQINKFVSAFVQGEIADYQMSAWLMASFVNGLSKKETFALTDAMMRSGVVLDLGEIPGLKIDKHSTGGVGDKTSLIVGPLVAAVGVPVPMISGRGLGHTGGTLDKLESIPGFSTQLSLDQFKSQIKELGVCFIGQTKDICPADKRMYALRDVTGTVENRSLICASIMSKKLAEGMDGLVLDVKSGSGAFMKKPKDAKALATALVEIARNAKKKVTAFITDMNQPLGNAIGNALEVEECFEVLKNRGPRDLRELSLELSAEMIHMGQKAKNIKHARNLAEEALVSGKALRCFEKVIEAQGGRLPLPRAQSSDVVVAKKNGFVTKMNAETLGLGSLLLGAGRKTAQESVDPTAGIVFHFKIGDSVKKGNALATLYFNGDKPVDEVKAMVAEAVRIGSSRVKPPKLILGRVSR